MLVAVESSPMMEAIIHKAFTKTKARRKTSITEFAQRTLRATTIAQFLTLRVTYSTIPSIFWRIRLRQRRTTPSIPTSELSKEAIKSKHRTDVQLQGVLLAYEPLVPVNHLARARNVLSEDEAAELFE